MRSISVISKSEVAPAPQKRNNFLRKELNTVINNIRFLIFTEALLGLNRVYLLQYSKYITILSELYSLVLLSVLVFFNCQNLIGDTVFKVSMIISTIEYALFVLITLTSRRNQLKSFFKNLSTFDETLNIQNDLAITSSAKKVVTWTLISVLSNSLEVFLLAIIYHPNSFFVLFSIFVMTASHDIEQVFFLTYMRNIYTRILIVKAHVAKLYDTNSKESKQSKVGKLSENIEFDVTTLYKVYELLHKCSEQINLAMNIPILLVFTVSSFSTIMLLKVLVSLLQMENPDMDVNMMIIYVVFRCVKYTVLVIIPCYFSSVTASQTSTIRTILHDAVITMPMDKIKRRKVKTFFHLTRESDFRYSICGVIELDMSLPLSYMSLCTTYLIIIIQFSKFIE